MVAALERSGFGSGGAVNLPNLISLGRLLLVPLVVYLLLQSAYGWAFAIFIVAGVSDAVDGFIAKRFGLTSALGAYLDPMADKALLVGVYISLGAQSALPVWLVILVVFRDLLIVGGVLFLQLLGQAVRVRPILISKANTAGQIALAAVVLADRAFEIDAGMLISTAIWIVAGTTLASGAAYLIAWARHAEPIDA